MNSKPTRAAFSSPPKFLRNLSSHGSSARLARSLVHARLACAVVLGLLGGSALPAHAGPSAVAAGGFNSLFVKPDGTLWGAGTRFRPAPVQLASAVSAVATSDQHTLFVKTDGTLWGLGENSNGQLGDGTTTYRSTPVQVATGVTAVAAGTYYSLFIKTDGTLWGMGYNGDGQLGIGTSTSRPTSTPVQIASEVRAVAAGYYFSFFIKIDGTLWATGFNSGELDGSNSRSTPAQIASGVRTIAAGYQHSLFVKDDGTLWAMGYNIHGQLGDGTTTSRRTPVQVGTGVSTVAAGSDHSLFVKTDGTLWAMGVNEWSQLGDGSFLNRTSPVQVATGVRAASGGNRHSLFVKTDDTFGAMGYNSGGELGDGTQIERNTPIGLLAPTFTMQPNTQAVTAGSSASFAVIATGTATLSYQWQKDGTPISGATAATYGIGSVAPANAGSYSVVVSNWIGSTASTAATLAVTAPPSITTQPSAQSVTPGSSATFTVIATGTSPLTYQWRKDGTAIPGATATTFNVASVAAPHVGSYSVIVSNSVSSLSSTPAALTLTPAAVAPSITTQPSAQNVAAGVSASLSVVASGTAPLSYQWKKNDVPIISATAPTYSLSSASTADTGTYTVVVTNSVGSVTSTTAALVVNTPPSITAQPVSQVVAAGASATFTVAASGTAPLTYQWLKVVGLVSTGITGATGATLNLTSVTMSDAANYAVIVTNSGGFVRSIAATLTVNTPPVITTQPSAQTVAAGSTLIQTVAATGSAPLSYQWIKDGTAISGAVGSTFARNPAAAADTGSYTVVVSNPFGSATSVAVTLNVNAPPVITTQPTAQSVTAGANASFNVIATGTAPLSYQWRKDGVPISGAVNPVLAIVSATTGSYTVIVMNSFGSVTSSSALLAVTAVATPPAITTQPSAQPATVGLSTSLAVIADGTAPLAYQWRKDGLPINGATTATYRIGSAAITDRGNYTVVVTNSAGSVTSTPTTLLVAPPATTFTQRHTSAASDNNLWSFASGGGVMVAVGQPGLIYSSTNGSNWTQRASGTNEWLVGVAYGNGLFVAVGDNGRVLRSTDGVSWTYAANVGTIFRLNAVIYAAGRWVAAGESGAIVTSTDANTWTPVLSGTTRYLHGLAYGAGYFVTTGGGGTVLASNDGITWLTRNSSTTRDLEACVFVSNHFLAVGEAGEAIIAYAPGGAANWYNYALYKPNTTSVLRGLAAGPGAIIAVTESGVIFSTPSIFNSWTQVPSTNANVLLTAGFAQDTFFALGFAALILQSDPVYDGRLSNLSTRGRAGAGADVLISGFVVRGNAPKQMLIRAAGPALTQFGITGALARPVLALFDGAGKPITANTGWGTAANVGAIRTAAIDIGAFPFAENSADSALLVPLSPGGYTAQVSGVAGTTGTTLIETYDLDNSIRMQSRLVNISSRGVVGTDQNIIIPGIATDGSSARLLLVRAIGPALDAFGVAGTLIDPQITVTRSTSTTSLGTNDNWNLQTGGNNNTFTAADIRDYTARAGAFTLPENSRDAALLFTTTPGANYTVQVSGVGNATGVALVEIYDVTGL